VSNAIFIDRDGHRTWLKWHRGRRRGTDPVFTGKRILEGMALGASVEVDLLVNADRGYAVLHNESLEKETTGSGLVRETPAAVLRQLHLRDNDGAPIEDKVMLLEDLAGLLAEGRAHPDALLQLDLKEDAKALDAVAVAKFVAAVTPVAGHLILSAGDAEAVAMLSAGVPRMHIGYDPCHGSILDQLKADGDFAGFVASSVAASPPRSEMIYLHHALVFAAADAGFDIVGAFHNSDRRIDAYTVNRADADGIAVARRLLGLKVDQITTDDPEGLGAALAAS
jgi:glycerophosphoryl diester phosphodiesterase